MKPQGQRVHHERYSHFQANASDPGEIDTMLSQLTGTALDILVYCAGITFPKYAMLLSDKEAAAILDANLLGAFTVTGRDLRGMKRRKFGRVILFSSIAVPLGHAGSVISVWGSEGRGGAEIAFSLSREFSDDNITFNSVGISIYPSPMLASMSPEGLAAARKGLVKSKDLGIDEIVGAVDYFCVRCRPTGYRADFVLRRRPFSVSVATVVNGRWRQNCYLVANDLRTRSSSIPEAAPIEIASSPPPVAGVSNGILNTHGHFDHVGAVAALKESYQAPFYLHRADEQILRRANLYHVVRGAEHHKGPRLRQKRWICPEIFKSGR